MIRNILIMGIVISAIIILCLAISTMGDLCPMWSSYWDYYPKDVTWPQ